MNKILGKGNPIDTKGQNYLAKVWEGLEKSREYNEFGTKGGGVSDLNFFTIP